MCVARGEQRLMVAPSLVLVPFYHFVDWPGICNKTVDQQMQASACQAWQMLLYNPSSAAQHAHTGTSQLMRHSNNQVLLPVDFAKITLKGKLKRYTFAKAFHVHHQQRTKCSCTAVH